jgi:hypothetical protein
VPPPLPQPNLADMMAIQTQLMQTITHLLAQTTTITTRDNTATYRRASRRSLRTSTSCDRQPLTTLRIRWMQITG